MTEEKIRPIFVVCPTCEGVGFVLFESIAFDKIEEPSGLIRAKCERCGGSGEIVKPIPSPET
jgi:DnaJ-class molecular chaperone